MKSLICLFLLFTFSLPALAAGLVEVPLGDAPSLGAADAPVVMVEFIDFQ
ncbi:hypothetical protein [Geopsychrobacter electrodiphilus]|nr:hypothetical protein [Geopsychrobacter electrodiphilus]